MEEFTPGFIQPFVRVRAEVVALGLGEVLGENRPPIAVEVVERCTESRDGNAQGIRHGEDFAPCPLAIENRLFEFGGQ